MIIATVTSNLNKRARPSVNAPVLGYLSPGAQVQAVDLVEGDPFEGNNLWLKAVDGNYYWSGGANLATDLPRNYNWNQEIQGIPDEWKKSRGKGIKVAVLDTGIVSSHPDLIGRISFDRAIDCSGDKNVIDVAEDSHGTHCCGLIGADSMGKWGVTGVAPECELYIAKVIHPSLGATVESIAAGIDWAIAQGVQIINLSLSATKKQGSGLIENAVGKAIKNNILVVGAGGNNGMLIDSVYYPATIPKCISVGAVTGEFLKNMNGESFNSRLDFFLPEIEIWSCSSLDNSLYKAQPGCSQACAFVTAIIALWMASDGLANASYDDARAALASVCVPNVSLLETDEVMLSKP